MGTDPDSELEASRLKAVAGAKFKSANLKSALKHTKKAHRLAPNLEGLSSMLTAFKILRVASKSPSNDTKDWYKILQVEPFSHINTIKKQYKKLALTLHPDKNPHLGCEEAFKLVGEGFGVLSDKIRRKEYDMRLRIKIQDEKVNGLVEKDTFWTACSRCRLLHQFERKYLGHNLICPSCKKSFKAVEVDENAEDQSNGVRVFRSERLNRKMVSVELETKLGNGGFKRKMISRDMKTKESASGGGEVESRDLGKEVGGEGAWRGGRLRSLRRRTSSVGEVLERSKLKHVADLEVLERIKPNRGEVGDETMTLAEMQLEAKRKANREKMKLKPKQKEMEEEGDKEKELEQDGNTEKEGKMDGDAEKEKENDDEQKGTGRSRVAKKSGGQIERSVVSKKSVDLRIRKSGAAKKIGNSQIVRQGALKKSDSLAIERRKSSKTEDLEIMAVEDSDFYDFDRDRVERSFKKGQVWAIYDDDDGMPRHYGLIDEAVSVNPFEVKISWLDLQNNGDEELIYWEKMGFHVSCGRFKVSRKTSIDSLNIFSHVMECERAAKDVYRIYPKKGSVWALYNEAALGAEGRNLSARDRRSYDIVMFLTTYSEMHGLSMSYLEKVDGFKTIFKRREVGCHAIRWLGKDDVRLFSHQIPARKLVGDDIPDRLKDCWELDPASLPSDLLTIGWGR